MANIEAGEIAVGGVTWAVEFDTKFHNFTAVAEGFPVVSGKSWDDLVDVAKVRVSQARTKVSVPYAHVVRVPGGFELRRGTATGIHASNGNVLVTVNGKPDQIRGFDSEYITPPDEATAARLAEIAGQIEELRREQEVIRRKHKFPEGSLLYQVRHEVDEARKARAKEAPDAG